MSGASNTSLYQRIDLARVYLPTGQMLQIDRVLAITADSIHAEVDLAQHWVFPLHLPSDPIFPACLMIEAAGQAIAIWAWHNKVPGNPRLARVKASFTSAVVPQDNVLTIRATVRRRKNICLGHAELSIAERPAAVIDETLAWV